MKLRTALWILCLVLPAALILGACRPVAAPAADTNDAAEAATRAATEAEGPEPEEAKAPPELTFETLAGLWEIGCISYEFNADGTYKAWSGRPQPGGFPKEAGSLELNGTQLTFHSGDDGLLCRNQSGTYEVIAWNNDQLELEMVADECEARKQGGIGTLRRVPAQGDETEATAMPAAEAAASAAHPV